MLYYMIPCEMCKQTRELVVWFFPLFYFKIRIHGRQNSTAVLNCWRSNCNNSIYFFLLRKRGAMTISCTMLRISLSFLLLRKCIEQKQAYIVKAVEEKRKKNTLLCCYCSAATLQYKVVFHQIVCCNFIFFLPCSYGCLIYIASQIASVRNWVTFVFAISSK